MNPTFTNKIADIAEVVAGALGAIPGYLWDFALGMLFQVVVIWAAIEVLF